MKDEIIKECRIEKHTYSTILFFKIQGKDYLLNFTNDKFNYLISSNDGVYKYDLTTIWDENLNYQGYKDNSLLP